jgi:hypothetical protein
LPLSPNSALAIKKQQIRLIDDLLMTGIVEAAGEYAAV